MGIKEEFCCPLDNAAVALTKATRVGNKTVDSLAFPLISSFEVAELDFR